MTSVLAEDKSLDGILEILDEDIIKK